ncbi:MAG: aminotransferase class IV [Chitinophagaceae bacterium]|nr:aminotransferase class IV [Chitinophagaceae bacterium]
MPGYFMHNGQLFREGKALISPDNRSFRYGDGLFETMRVIRGNILLKDFHFERLLQGMKLLQFDIPDFFTATHLEEDILSVCHKNRIEEKAVARLVIFRSDGGLYDLEDMRPNYIIQSMPLQRYNVNLATNEGLSVDIYPDASKACNIFSGIKSNNHLLYVMAAIYARENGLNDCLILNQYGRIADGTIANVFWIKDGTVFTPPLDEGCVAGVTRKFILQQLPTAGYRVKESLLTADTLLEADEVFLTNAVRGIRSVAKFRSRNYLSRLTKEIHAFLSDKWK